jgi:hypothetical protein
VRNRKEGEVAKLERRYKRAKTMKCSTKDQGNSQRNTIKVRGVTRSLSEPGAPRRARRAKRRNRIECYETVEKVLKKELEVLAKKGFAAY